MLSIPLISPHIHFISDVCLALALPLEEVVLERSQGTWDIALCKSGFEIRMEHITRLLLPLHPQCGVKDPSRANMPSAPRSPPLWARSWDCRAASHMSMFASQTGEKASQNQPFVQKIAPRSLPVCRTRQSRLVISLKISGRFVFEHHHRKIQSYVQSAVKAAHTVTAPAAPGSCTGI